jgi:hypothetical protein
MSIKKQMESSIYKLIEFLGGHYGFDADEAFELSEDYVVALLPKEEKKVEEKKEEKEKPSPLEVARKNVSLWTKKLEADKFKDEDAKEKHIAKLDKEKAKLAKLEPKVEPKPAAKAAAKPAAKPAAKAAAKAEEKPAEKEKRIKRMSPKLKESLKEVLDKAGVEMTDKVVKEFVEYVEKLSDEEFVPKGLADHMRDFAETKAPTEEAEEESEESEEEDSGAGTGLKTEVKAPVQLSMEELSSITLTASVDPPGTFWDAENGRLVTGPDADDDEDISEIKFENKTYGVGDKSGRVYLEVNDRDVFQGFIGVGKFKKMTRA